MGVSLPLYGHGGDAQTQGSAARTAKFHPELSAGSIRVVNALPKLQVADGVPFRERRAGVGPAVFRSDLPEHAYVVEIASAVEQSLHRDRPPIDSCPAPHAKFSAENHNRADALAMEHLQRSCLPA